MAVIYKRRTVGYETSMPTAISRRHEKPKYGDSKSAILRSRGKALDANQVIVRLRYQVSKGVWIYRRVPVSGHWGVLGLDGYTHTTKGPQKGLRRLTREEKQLTYQQWVDKYDGMTKDLNALRKKGSALSRAYDNYPMTWYQQVRLANVVGAVLIPETKSSLFADPEVVDLMARVCKKANYPLWPMTLIWMKYAREKCEAFRSAGEDFAIIFGNRRRLAFGPNLVKHWKHKPTRVWGPLPARRWV